MKKSHYDALMEKEREWIGTFEDDWELLTEFWIDGFTHIVISKRPDGNYQILRSWLFGNGTPAISIDSESADLSVVIDYLRSKIKTETPSIEED